VKRPAKPLVEIIVRRGALRRYDKLTTRTSELPVQVRWDRRVNLIGNPPLGLRNRRGPLPFTWKAADFVVVEAEAEPTEAAAPASDRKPKRRRR
jgi:hypothetical protein